MTSTDIGTVREQRGLAKVAGGVTVGVVEGTRTRWT